MNDFPLQTRGFTLIEMMVTVAVLAILMAIAVPSFSNVMRRSDVSSGSNALLADIAYARSEAVNRHTIVSICPSSNGTSCTDDKTYETGWIVYTYQNGKAVANTDYVDGTDVLLRSTQARKGVSMQANSAKPISFGQQGQMIPSGTTVAFEVCYRSPSETGTGSSTTAVPGANLTVSGSGSVLTTSLGVMTGCTPS